jgi:predicted metal-dependent phosphotriesterase family hydrolase
MNGQVRTVLGDVAPEDLGVTYLHEHLIIDSPLIADTMAHIHLPDPDEAVSEMRLCLSAGVSTMVDTMPAGSGRGVVRLAEASRRSGMHIIASTGLHTAKYYDTVLWAKTEDADGLAARFIADIEIGIDRLDYLGAGVDRTDMRAGIIKAATFHEPDPRRDRRVFEAAAIAARQTGAPVLTHCEAGVGGLEQIELLSEFGVPLHRVVLSHTDKVDDLDYHKALLESGVNLEYDQALRHSGEAVGVTANLLASMIEEGFLAQLMLGTDGARRTLWSALGGTPGLSWLASGFRLAMSEAGVTDDDQRALFVRNPRRFLAFRNKGPSVVV